MGSCSFHVGEWKSWKSAFLEEEKKKHTTLHYIFYRLNFSAYLPKNTSTAANKTVM
jgi:hypothetical protein